MAPTPSRIIQIGRNNDCKIYPSHRDEDAIPSRVEDNAYTIPSIIKKSVQLMRALTGVFNSPPVPKPDRFRVQVQIDNTSTALHQCNFCGAKFTQYDNLEGHVCKEKSAEKEKVKNYVKKLAGSTNPRQALSKALEVSLGIPINLDNLDYNLEPRSGKRKDITDLLKVGWTSNTDETSSRPGTYIPNQTGRYADSSGYYLGVFPEGGKFFGDEETSPYLPDAPDPSSSDEEIDIAEPDERNRTASQTPPSDHSSASTEDYIDEIGNQIIDSIVRTVTQWLFTNFASAHQATRGAGEPSQSNSFQSAESGQHNRPGPSRKRRSSDRINDNDGEDDNDDQDSLRISPDSKGKDPQRRKFACPYFKYNPTKYQEWRNCPGPGWPDVHRVKEHLYRRHRQPRYRCGRCWQPFENEEDHIDHQRATEPCPLRDKEPVEGFDASQEKRLRSRKKTTNCQTEIAKWEAVFSILFPHVPEERIPSPFYEYDQSTNAVPNPHDSLTECEEYILREAIDKTRTLLAEVFREFRQIQQRGTIPEVEPGVIEAADVSGSNPTQAPPMVLQDTRQNPPGAVNLNDFNFNLNLPAADNVGSNFTRTPPTVSQYNEQNLSEETNVDDLQSWMNFFDPSALDDLQASLSGEVTMEEIMQQPVGYTEQKKSDSGYESYSREDTRQEFFEGSE
ncbi:hypothetical protein F4806DRAFT_507681 [Annulohypoxylon nitens]|nr:hypothetical protein F4806DRAFT_507681 [Annulohypoxylon nitens]